MRIPGGFSGRRAAAVFPWPLAVVDVETTGLWAEGTDRVVEVAVVGLGPDLEPAGEYASLVHPHRDLGPSWLHGITGAHVADAPSFDLVADDVARALQGRVVAGFAVHFDLRFLRAEFLRLGIELPPIPSIDLRSVTGGSLEDACAGFGIAIDGAHSALGDARATAELLRAVHAARLFRPSRTLAPPPAEVWPDLDYERTEWRREDVVMPPPDALAALPPLCEGLSVCFTGNSDLLLGQIELTRPRAEQLAADAGFVVRSAVTKQLELLVASDPWSTSSKAARARRYGIPVVHEVVFWRALGYEVRPAR